jgi:hypothetical protein
MLFCPQSFQQALLLHSWPCGSGFRQHERLIRLGCYFVRLDLKPASFTNYVFIKLTIWYYLATFIVAMA